MAERRQGAHTARGRWRWLLLGILAAGGALAWHLWAIHWRPDPQRWAVQGVALGSANQPIGWASLPPQGVRFAYIDAAHGNRADAGFTVLADGARAAGLRTGAIHHFSLCVGAGDQAAAFVQLVPRDASSLPPVVLVEDDGSCARKPTRALLLNELTTFLTQIETHLGKVAIVGSDADVAARYDLAASINRPLWLERLRAEPETRGWTIWLANERRIEGVAHGRVRWLVLDDAQPRERQAQDAKAQESTQ